MAGWPQVWPLPHSVEQFAQGQLASLAGWLLQRSVCEHGQALRRGHPVVAPHLRGQVRVDRQAAQLAPAHLHPGSREAMAATAAAGASTHGGL